MKGIYQKALSALGWQERLSSLLQAVLAAVLDAECKALQAHIEAMGAEAADGHSTENIRADGPDEQAEGSSAGGPEAKPETQQFLVQIRNGGDLDVSCHGMQQTG